MLDEIRLLSLREMRSLFPDCEIITDRFLLVFSKSYTAFRPARGEAGRKRAGPSPVPA